MIQSEDFGFLFIYFILFTNCTICVSLTQFGTYPNSIICVLIVQFVLYYNIIIKDTHCNIVIEGNKIHE